MIDNTTLQEVVQYVLGSAPQKPFLCLPMSATFYVILKDEFKLDAKLVAGDLLYKGNHIFKHDFPIATAKDAKFQEWAGHAWVEHEGIIYDMSFLRTLHSKEFQRPYKEELIIGFDRSQDELILTPDFLKYTGLEYKPVEYLSDDLATGILRGFDSLLKMKK